MDHQYKHYTGMFRHSEDDLVGQGQTGEAQLSKIYEVE